MSSESRFNLIDEPWIPIAEVGRVSLKQVFSNPDYRSLGGNPIQKIALTKLLLAIAQAAYTPGNDTDWAALQPSGMAQKCLTYLEQWHDRFWLYGEKPFLQMPAVASAEIQSVGAVLPEVSTGNTTILTQIQVEKILNDAEKAVLIVSLMGFGLGGKKTDNSVILSKGYRGKTNEKHKPTTGKPGVSMGHWGFMHNFLFGESLLQTLWLNLFTQLTLIERIKCFDGVGVPPWEKMPEGECCPIANALRNSLMGRLLPLSRFCLLAKGQEGLHYSEGIAYPSYKEGGIDPSIAINFTSGKVIWIDPETRPWRYLTALLSFIVQGNKEGFNCIQLKEGLNRVCNQVPQVGIWSGGLRASGSTAGEQYVSGHDDFVESTIILENQLIGELWYNRLQLEMEEMDQLSKAVYACTLSFFKNQKSDAKKQAEMAKHLFWQLCERQFQALIRACNDRETVKKMRSVIAGIVHQVYDTFCPKETARQLEAWAECRPKLGKYLR